MQRQREMREAVRRSARAPRPGSHARRSARERRRTRRRRAPSSGRLHSPDHMPVGGRRSNRISPLRSSTSTRTARCGSDLRGTRRRQLGDRGPRSAPRNRRRPDTRGTRACACTRSRRDPSAPACSARCRVAGNSDSAAAHSSRSTFGAPGKPSMPRCRASTRLTLPSRIAARAPNANAAIAAAVERPMPGSAAMAATSRGNVPAVLRRRSPSPRHADDARGGSSRARPVLEDAVDRSRRRARARRESSRGSARSTAARSRPASAAA